jgi:mevalonate kinase
LDKLWKIASRLSYGSTLVGAGGGGCVVSITDKPQETVDAINSAGGSGMILTPSTEGLKVETPKTDNDDKGSGDEPDPQ